MMETLDQVFVLLKHGLVALFPEPARPLVSVAISVAAIIAVFGGLFAITTVLERKGLGRIQNRRGPNRVGIPLTDIRLAGFGQFAADGIKALIKEDLVPRAADKVIHFLAPIALVLPVFLAYSVLPVGRNMVALDLDAGVLFMLSVGSATELSVFMAGWASRNKYSLLGAMRAIAQMISYEVPLILSAIVVIMAVGSLSTVQIVEAQTGYHFGWLARWHVFTPWGFAGFILFMIAAAAESNRTPFDLPEGESEIIAGYYIEYSGFKFALFFLGEYLGMFVISGLGITLFLGGWTAPVSWLAWIPSYVWFFAKLMAIVFGFIWARGTLPRLRMDQLMNFAWKFMLPLVLLNIAVAGIWILTASIWPGWGRWLLCAGILAAAYLGLGSTLNTARKVGKRSYRYAD